MKKYINFKIKKNDTSEELSYSFKLNMIDSQFYTFLLGEGSLWHIDFKDRKVFARHNGDVCRINNDRVSLFFHNSKSCYIQDLQFNNVNANDSRLLFRIDITNIPNITEYKIFTKIDNFDELLIKAMYVLVETYKKKVLKLNPPNEVL